MWQFTPFVKGWGSKTLQDLSAAFYTDAIRRVNRVMLVFALHFPAFKQLRSASASVIFYAMFFTLFNPSFVLQLPTQRAPGLKKFNLERQ